MHVEKTVRRASQPHRRMPSWRVCLLTLTFIAVLWIVFVGGTRVDEMIVGFGVILLSSAFLYQVWRTETLKIRLAPQDVAQGWSVPWQVFTDICQIIAVLAATVFRHKRTGSFYRVVRFRTSKSDPRLIGRRVLATFYTTMAPNSIVIGIDPDQNRMLFHHLKRTGIPKMTQALGARPGAAP